MILKNKDEPYMIKQIQIATLLHTSLWNLL